MENEDFDFLQADHFKKLLHSQGLEVKETTEQAQKAIEKMLQDKWEAEAQHRNLIKQQLQDYEQNSKDIKEGLRIANNSYKVAIAALVVAILTLLLTIIL